MKIEDIAESIRALAAQAAWPEGAARATALKTPATGNWALATSVPEEAAPLQTSLAQRAKAEPLHIARLSALLDDPAAALAPKLLLVFTAGQMIDSDQAAVLTRLFALRPAGSFAVVMAHAENLRDENDLKLIERGAWRLLVPEPPSNPSVCHLRDYGVFLWTDTAPAPELAPRLQADADALDRWLETPPPALEPARARLLLGLLDELDARCRRMAQAASSPAELARQQLLPTVRDYRGRLQRALESNGELMVNEVPSTLRHLGDELRASLKARLAGNRARSLEEVRAVIESGLREEAPRWKETVAGVIQKYTGAIGRDLDNMRHVVDWSAVNARLAPPLPGALYPDGLVQIILDGGESLSTAGGTARVDGLESAGESEMDIAVPVVFSLSGGVVVVGWVLAWPAAATVTAVAATLVAAVALSKNTKKRINLNKHPHVIDEVVKTFLAEQAAHFDRETRRASSQMIARLNRRFDELERQLQLGAAPDAAHPAGPDVTTRVQELRAQLTPLAN